jgi:hypothetical protein
VEIEMLPDRKKATNIYAGLGTALCLAGAMLSIYGGTVGLILGIILVAAGVPCLVLGLLSYAQGKGHAGAFGLMGFIPLVGLWLLFALPDHSRESADASLFEQIYYVALVLSIGTIVVLAIMYM